jgi:SAM-dependent methyltransferase
VLFQDRTRAESFGADAERYDRARPTYPAEMVDEVLAGFDTGAVTTVVDVGCGTGIAGRLFTDRGCQVLGVEPDERMAARARVHGLTVEVAAFETWQPVGRTFDLLISGQAWHWVHPETGALRAAEVLRPGGRIALFWNIGRPSDEVADAFEAVYRRRTEGLDEYSVLLGGGDKERFHQAGEGIRASRRFSDPDHRSFDWTRPYSRDEWLDQLPTHSDHQALPPDQLGELMDELGDVIESFGGTFTMGYLTALITAERVE